MPVTSQELSVEFAKEASEALEEAGQLVEEAAAKQASVAAAIPRTVDALVATGLIENSPAVRKEASDRLADPVSALSILDRLAGEYVRVVQTASKTASEAPVQRLGAVSAHPQSNAPAQSHDSLSQADAAFVAAYLG